METQSPAVPAESSGPKAGRRSGRAGRAGRQPAIEQKPFRQPRMIFPPTPGVSADELESIHEASLTILEEIGMDFLHEEAKADPIVGGLASRIAEVRP